MLIAYSKRMVLTRPHHMFTRMVTPCLSSISSCASQLLGYWFKHPQKHNLLLRYLTTYTNKLTRIWDRRCKTRPSKKYLKMKAKTMSTRRKTVNWTKTMLRMISLKKRKLKKRPPLHFTISLNWSEICSFKYARMSTYYTRVREFAFLTLRHPRSL